MNIITYLKRSATSLSLHRLRSLLSILGILFGVTSVVAMLSIGEGAKRETLEQIEQLGINSVMIKQNALSDSNKQQALENLSYGLSENDALLFKKNMPNLVSIAPIKVLKAHIPSALQNMAPEIMAVTREYGEIKSLKLKSGRFITDLDKQEKKQVVILGYDVARALGRAGTLQNTLRIENTSFGIVGILEPSQWKTSKNAFLATKNINKAIFIPLGSENTLRSYQYPENDLLSEIILQMKPGQDFTKTTAMIKRLLTIHHRSYEDYQIIVPQELLNQANQTQRTFNLILGSIATISLLVGGIGIMNMMLANVTERIREIGIRRALGATKKNILLQFLNETLLLTLFGALLGVIFGVLFSFFISYFAGWQTVVTLWSLALSLAMASIVGICSGLYPAYKAAMLHPIVALRHVT